MTRRPPTSTLFPDTTLFRSRGKQLPLQTRGEEKTPGKPTEGRQPRQKPSKKTRSIERSLKQLLDVPALPLKRSEEHTSELQSRQYLVCSLLLEKKQNNVYLI